MNSTETSPASDPAAVRSWLRNRLAQLTRVEPAEIGDHEPFANYGLSSHQAVALAGDLEEWVGRELEPTLVWDFPDIDTLARYIATGESPARSE